MNMNDNGNRPKDEEAMIFVLSQLPDEEDRIPLPGKGVRKNSSMFFVNYRVKKDVWESNQEKIMGAVWALYRSKVSDKRKILYFEANLGTYKNNPASEYFIINVFVEYNKGTEIGTHSGFDIPYSVNDFIKANSVVPTSKTKFLKGFKHVYENLDVVKQLMHVNLDPPEESESEIKKFLTEVISRRLTSTRQTK